MGGYYLLFNHTRKEIAAGYESSMRSDFGAVLRGLARDRGWKLEDKMCLLDYFDYHESACTALKSGYRYVARLGFDWPDEGELNEAEEQGAKTVAARPDATLDPS